MKNDLTLYGFDGSTYVRSVRMILANKQFDYELVPVNVLEGEPKQPAHLERNPFGRVPVIDHQGVCLYETSAITRYLDEVIPGQSHTPYNPGDRARMNMAMGIVDSDGYGGMIMVAAYHLFPDFVGGKDEKVREESISKARLVLTEIMKIRGDSSFIAGESLSIADCYLAPLCFYVSLTEDASRVFGIDGFDKWWQRIQSLPCYQATEPASD